jgi:hypothetical protein
MAAKLPEESKLTFKLGKNILTVALALIGIGLALTALQIAMPWHPEGHHGGGEGHGPGTYARLFYSLHLALLVSIPLGLGGLFFVALNHAAGASWNVTVRRLAENYVWFLPFVFILMLVILFFGMHDVFHHWVGVDLETDMYLKSKSPWLNVPFFTVRNIVIVLVWIIFGFILRKNSIDQDTSGKFSKTKANIKLGSAFLIVFGLTFSFSSWDLSMSVEPHFFSTMWAVYTFAGLAITTHASLILWVWYLKRAGYYGDAVNVEHIHDLGKYMWGFTIFWAYIGFSQFMLIWYAHITEETYFYHDRIYGDMVNGVMPINTWYYVGIALVLVRFILPFFLIMRRDAKRNVNFLASVAALHIVGQVIDMYWIVYPTLDHGNFVMLGWQELGTLMLMGGFFILSVSWGLTRSSMIPLKDPKLDDCLHHHQ